MKKRIIAALIMIVMLIGMLPLTASAAEAVDFFVGEYVNYEICPYTKENDLAIFDISMQAVEEEYGIGLRFGDYIKLKGTPKKAGHFNFKLTVLNRADTNDVKFEGNFSVEIHESHEWYAESVELYAVGQTVYSVGDTFNPDGWKVRATYTDVCHNTKIGDCTNEIYFEDFKAPTFNAEGSFGVMMYVDLPTREGIDQFEVTGLVHVDKKVTEPKITTKTLDDGIVGEAYNVNLKASGDTPITWSEYYNPGKKNELSNSGLQLSTKGLLTGVPTKAGTYTFTVCASNAAGEDYKELKVTFVEKATEPTVEEPTESPYGLYVGGIAVTDKNCADILGDGTAIYTPANDTLSLQNAYIIQTLNNDGFSAIGILSTNDLKMEIVGYNTLHVSNYMVWNCAVQVDGKLELVGDGELDVIYGAEKETKFADPDGRAFCVDSMILDGPVVICSPTDGDVSISIGINTQYGGLTYRSGILVVEAGYSAVYLQSPFVSEQENYLIMEGDGFQTPHRVDSFTGCEGGFAVGPRYLSIEETEPEIEVPTETEPVTEPETETAPASVDGPGMTNPKTGKLNKILIAAIIGSSCVLAAAAAVVVVLVLVSKKKK